MEWFDAFIVVFASGMRLAIPLILACLAGLWSERSGIVDIGLEGKILVGAFASAAAATFTGSVWLGLLAGVAAAVVVSLIHGYASIDQRANQIVSGTAINMVADGLTALIGNAIWSQGGRTPQLPETAQFKEITLPFVSEIGAVPILGPIYRRTDLRPRPDRLHRLRDGPGHLLGPLQHALRAASARGRRESGRRRHRRHFGARPALRRAGHLRDSGRPRRRLSRARPDRLFPAAHERRTRLHRACGAGVREVAARGRRSRPAFCSASSTRWRSACRGWSCPSSGRCRCRRSRPCPIS